MAGTFSNVVKPTANPLSLSTRPLASPFATSAPKTTPFAAALSNVSSGVKTSVPTPSTPLKSVTTNNMDGSSTVHEYHAPPKPATTGSQSSGLTQSDVLNNLSKAGFTSSGLLRNDTSSYQSGGNPNASPSLVGQQAPAPGTTTAYGGVNTPNNISPATNGAPQYAPSSPYASTDQSPEAVAWRAQNPQNNYATAVQNLANVSQSNPDVAQARQGLLAYKQGVLDKQGAIDATGADLAFKQGEQQTLQRTSQEGLLARQAALSNALDTQKIQQSGAQSVVSATAPLLGQYGQNNYNPLSGGSTGGDNGGTLNPLNNISTIAQQVLSGQISPQAAKSMGGNVANFNGALNAELYKQSGGKYNEATQQAAYDSRQSNATAAGTATTNANVSGYAPALQSYNDVKLKLNNVEDLGSLAVNTGTLGGINPFDVQYANMGLSQFRKQLSSEAQKRFDSSIATFSGAASSLLADASGQTPTGVTGLTHGVVDPNITMGALKGLVDQAKKEGAIKAGNQASQVVNYKASINGQNPPNLPGTMSSGGITYVLGIDGTYNPLR